MNVLLFAWLAGRALKASSAAATEGAAAGAATGRAATEGAAAGAASGRAASAGLIGLAAFASILVSKVFYYGLKALVLSAGLLQMELVATALWIQLIVAVAISLAAALRFRQ